MVIILLLANYFSFPFFSSILFYIYLQPRHWLKLIPAPESFALKWELRTPEWLAWFWWKKAGVHSFPGHHSFLPDRVFAVETSRECVEHHTWAELTKTRALYRFSGFLNLWQGLYDSLQPQHCSRELKEKCLFLKEKCLFFLWECSSLTRRTTGTGRTML